MSGRVVAAVLLFAQAAVSQIPVVAPGQVLNGASFALPGQPGYAVAPGSLVSIFGDFYAPAPQVATSIPLPFELANISVRFNGISAPLLFVSGGQINAQLPWDVVSELPPGTTGTVSVVVTRNALPSAPQTVQVARFSPGIYTLNNRLALAVNAGDGTIAQPPGAITGLTTHAAVLGSAILVYLNGLGPVDKPVASGNLSSDPITRTSSEPVVRIGGVVAPVLFSGLAPQFVGVNQVNVLIPADAPVGDAVPFQVEVGGITTPQAITIAIRR